MAGSAAHQIDTAAGLTSPDSIAVPSVSVVIPSKDSLEWLPRAIDSVGSDTSAEIIVVDDGSSDGTSDWLRAMSAADPRLVPLWAPGVGPSRARNLALHQVKAPLVAFLDADDVWHPGKFALQIAFHQRHPEIGFSFTDYRHVSEEGDDHGPCFSFWPRFSRRHGGKSEAFLLGDDAFAQIFAENVVGTSTVMARADALRSARGFSPDLPSAADWDLWLRLARVQPVGCIPAVLADYLMHRPGSMTSHMENRIQALHLIGERHCSHARSFDRSAEASWRARLHVATAEMSSLRADPEKRWRAFVHHSAAFAFQPSRRGAREAVAAFVMGGLGMTREDLRRLRRRAKVFGRT